MVLLYHHVLPCWLVSWRKRCWSGACTLFRIDTPQLHCSHGVVSDDTCEKMFLAAVTLVIKDDGFTVPSRPAVLARELAKTLLEWSLKTENKSTCLAFSAELIHRLEECFETRRSLRMRRERMWENYFKLRSSDDFKKWVEVLSHCDASRNRCPVCD